MNKSTGHLRWIIFIFLIGFTIFYLRDSMTYRNPILYTEDGVWLGMIKEHGFLYAFLNARGDYFVAINIIIIQFANIVNFLVFNNSLLAYPSVLAIFVTAWYAFVVSLPAILFFRFLNPWLWLIFVCCLALLPFGHTGYEILARASNVGFSAFYVALFCIAYRASSIPIGIIKLLTIDLVIILCVLTNPLVLFLYLLLLTPLWKSWRSGKPISEIVTKNYLLILLLGVTFIIVLFFLYRYQAAPLIGISLEKKVPVKISDLITYGFGRSLIYPFLGIGYSLLNNYLTIFLSIFILISIYYCIRFDEEIKPLVYLLLASWLFVTVATAILRPGLIEMLSSYQATNPDRYAITQNLLLLSAGIFSFLRILSQSVILNAKSVIAVILITNYIVQSIFVSWIEHARPPYESYLGSQLQISLSATENSSKSGFISVPIYFLGWSTREKLNALEKLSVCCDNVFSLAKNPSISRDITKNDDYWQISGIDPMSYWFFQKPIPANQIPIIKFKLTCDSPTIKSSVIGVYWLDSDGNASGDRAFTFKAIPGWQVIPLSEFKNYNGNIGGLRLDMESTDTCKTYDFSDIEFFKWKTGEMPPTPKLRMPWDENAPRNLLNKLYSAISI